MCGSFLVCERGGTANRSTILRSLIAFSRHRLTLRLRLRRQDASHTLNFVDLAHQHDGSVSLFLDIHDFVDNDLAAIEERLPATLIEDLRGRLLATRITDRLVGSHRGADVGIPVFAMDAILEVTTDDIHGQTFSLYWPQDVHKPARDRQAYLCLRPRFFSALRSSSRTRSARFALALRLKSASFFFATDQTPGVPKAPRQSDQKPE